MLRIDLAEGLINDLQQTTLGGGYAGAQRANAIRAIRGALLNLSAAFNRVQARAGALGIANGRADTIAAALAPYGGEYSWPHKSAGCFRDWCCPSVPRSPARPRRHCEPARVAARSIPTPTFAR